MKSDNKKDTFWFTCISETYAFTKQRFPDLLTGHLRSKRTEVHNGETD